MASYMEHLDSKSEISVKLEKGALDREVVVMLLRNGDNYTHLFFHDVLVLRGFSDKVEVALGVGLIGQEEEMFC